MGAGVGGRLAYVGKDAVAAPVGGWVSWELDVWWVGSDVAVDVPWRHQQAKGQRQRQPVGGKHVGLGRLDEGARRGGLD